MSGGGRRKELGVKGWITLLHFLVFAKVGEITLHSQLSKSLSLSGPWGPGGSIVGSESLSRAHTNDSSSLESRYEGQKHARFLTSSDSPLSPGGCLSLHCVPSSRSFRGEWPASHFNQDPAASVNEDHARDHVQTGSALCPLRAADGASAKPGRPLPHISQHGEPGANASWALVMCGVLRSATSQSGSLAQQSVIRVVFCFCFTHQKTSLIIELVVLPLYIAVGSISRQSVIARAGAGGLAMSPDVVTTKGKGSGTSGITALPVPRGAEPG